MSILFSWLDPLRTIFIFLDGVAYSFLDNAYNILIELSSAELLNHEKIYDITLSLYVLVGLVAFFRLALVLVNSIIDPEKFSEKGKGLSNIFFRVVGMIVLLAVTPFLFQMSYDITGKLVSSDANQNVIFQVFLGDKMAMGGYENGEYNAGKALQNIVLSSLITVDKSYLTKNGATCQIHDDGKVFDEDGKDTGFTYKELGTNGNGVCGYVPLKCVPDDENSCTMYGGYYYNNDNCKSQKCKNAVTLYNNMYRKEDMSPTKLTQYVNVSEELKNEDTGEEENVYVYSYMVLVTTAAGIFLTYMIISFAIDIAVRMFELIVLEILSPLFIATFVDPNSAQNGPFKNWLSAVGKSYVSLYIKLAIIALFTFFLMIVGEFTLTNDLELTSLARIFLVIGLLIFAKKAPKWINGILGIKDEGLGGLGIGKKLGGMALAGGLVSKGLGAGKNALKKTGRGIAGSALGMINGGLRNRRQENIDKKQKGLDKKGKKAFRDQYLAEHGGDSSGFRSAWSQKKKEAGFDSKSKAARAVASTMSGAGLGFTAGVKADKLSGALKGGITASNRWADEQGLGGETLKDKVLRPGRKGYEKLMNRAYGDENDRLEARENLKKEKLSKDMYTEEGLSLLGGIKNTDLTNSRGSFIAATTDSNGQSAISLQDAYAMIGAKAQGLKAEYVDGQLQITGKDGNQIDVSEYSKKIQDMTNDIGAAQIKDWFIKSQQSVISEYQSTSQYIAQANQNISNASRMLNTVIQSKASTIPGISVSNGLTNIPGVDGNMIAIGPDNADASSLDAIISQSQADLQRINNDPNISDEQKMEAANKHNAVSNFVNMLKGDPTISNYSASIRNAKSDLAANIQRQAQIEEAYKNIGADKNLVTYQQKLDYVTNEQSKIDKQLEALKNNDKKDDK